MSEIHSEMYNIFCLTPNREVYSQQIIFAAVISLYLSKWFLFQVNLEILLSRF
jgi:hypothetical protein